MRLILQEKLMKGGLENDWNGDSTQMHIPAEVGLHPSGRTIFAFKETI